MPYKFQSRATGDVLMMQPVGDQLLRALGREPAARGIFEVAHMPGLMDLLEQAIALEERTLAEAQAQAEAEGKTIKRPEVLLRQRFWPMREMMRRSLAEDQPIVWGV